MMTFDAALQQLVFEFHFWLDKDARNPKNVLMPTADTVKYNFEKGESQTFDFRNSVYDAHNLKLWVASRTCVEFYRRDNGDYVVRGTVPHYIQKPTVGAHQGKEPDTLWLQAALDIITDGQELKYPWCS